MCSYVEIIRQEEDIQDLMGEQENGVLMGRRGSRNFVNLGEPEDVPPDAPKDAVRREFARRLYHAMVMKGWNQSELARQVSTKLGKPVPRDNVSNWVRGLVLPMGDRLIALAELFGMTPEDLVVSEGRPSADLRNPKFELRGLNDGTSWLKVNRRVSRELGRKIVNMLEDEPETDT